MNGLAFTHIYRTLANCMKQFVKDKIKVRIISCAFVALALAVFKPFGLTAWQWHAFVHLLIIFLLGIIVCLITDFIIDKIIKKPYIEGMDADLIIRRNLWFQLINTPLISLMICLYRHFFLSDRVEGNRLSWSNFFETLIIIAFCSFAIGLYWRFKYRSRYLAAELEEMRLLNEELKRLQKKADELDKVKESETLDKSDHQQTELSGTKPASSTIVLSGTTNESVALMVSNLLYLEAVGNYVKVYHLRDDMVCTNMLRATLKQMEGDLKDYPMIVRCHRAFLVNLGMVDQIVSKSDSMQLIMKHGHEAIPVSRSHTGSVKETIKAL